MSVWICEMNDLLVSIFYYIYMYDKYINPTKNEVRFLSFDKIVEKSGLFSSYVDSSQIDPR